MEFSQGHMKKEFDIVEAFKEEGRLMIYNDNSTDPTNVLLSWLLLLYTWSDIYILKYWTLPDSARITRLLLRDKLCSQHLSGFDLNNAIILPPPRIPSHDNAVQGTDLLPSMVPHYKGFYQLPTIIPHYKGFYQLPTIVPHYKGFLGLERARDLPFSKWY